MIDKIFYKIIPDLRLIIESGKGKLYFENGLNLKLQEVNAKDYNPNFNYLVDYRNLEIMFTEQDFERYVEFLHKDKNIIGARKSALLTNTPQHVVINYFYREALKEFPMQFEIFSTMNSALNWLGISVDNEVMIQEIISNNLDDNKT